MDKKPPCYGTMLPDLDRMECNTPCRGKAFTALVRSYGVDAQSHEVSVDAEAWDDCQRCPVYRSCYDLAMAMLALREALARR